MRVICTRPNASTEINGVKFTPLEDGTGVISEEVSEEVAANFLLVPGYHDADGEPVEQTVPAPAPKAPPKAAPTPKAGGKKAPTAPVEPPAPAADPVAPNPDAPPAPDDETAF